MVTVVFGGSGRLGAVLTEQLIDEHGYDAVFAPSHNDVHVENKDELVDYLDSVSPNVIINCASVTDVNYCEEHFNDVYEVHAFAPGMMAVWCMENDARLIHISSDYVFRTNVFPDRATGALYNAKAHGPTHLDSVYGSTKRMGEHWIEWAGGYFADGTKGECVIIRTSNLYGGVGGVKTVADKMIQSARIKGRIRTSSGVFTSPTFVDHLAYAIRDIARITNTPGGVQRYNVCGESMTYLTFANILKDVFGLKVVITTDYEPTSDAPEKPSVVMTCSTMFPSVIEGVREWKCQQLQSTYNELTATKLELDREIVRMKEVRRKGNE